MPSFLTLSDPVTRGPLLFDLVSLEGPITSVFGTTDPDMLLVYDWYSKQAGHPWVCFNASRTALIEYVRGERTFRSMVDPASAVAYVDMNGANPSAASSVGDARAMLLVDPSYGDYKFDRRLCEDQQAITDWLARVVSRQADTENHTA